MVMVVVKAAMASTTVRRMAVVVGKEEGRLPGSWHWWKKGY
jgi:hypothetical protein